MRSIHGRAIVAICLELLTASHAAMVASRAKTGPESRTGRSGLAEKDRCTGLDVGTRTGGKGAAAGQNSFPVTRVMTEKLSPTWLALHRKRVRLAHLSVKSLSTAQPRHVARHGRNSGGSSAGTVQTNRLTLIATAASTRIRDVEALTSALNSAQPRSC